MTDQNQKAKNESVLNSPDINLGEIMIGDLIDINEQGQPVINFDGNILNRSLVAISTVAVNKQHIGRKVAILFSNGNADQPVIMGMVHSPLTEMLDVYETNNNAKQQEEDLQQLEPVPNTDQVLKVDGKRITLEGKEEVVLKCGDASITLTKAGKILIRGKYLLNRSDGVNRIMGGSVQIN